MKKIIAISVLLLSGIFFFACDDESSTVEPPANGTITITSNPAGAAIYLDGTITNSVTPATIEATPGVHEVTLKLASYVDETFQISVQSDQNSPVVKDLTPEVVTYGPIKLWETTGTTTAQPSGLDLSTGLAYGVSGTDKDKVDIFYSSTGYLVKSSDQSTSMTRETKFKVGASTDLTDGVDAPAVDASWTKEMGDRETNYVFLYDNDGNFSKIKIVNFGGGVPGEPAWLEVTWIYNKAKDNKLF